MHLGLVTEPEERAVLVVDQGAAEVVEVLDRLPREVGARDEELDASCSCSCASLGVGVALRLSDIEPPCQLGLHLGQEVLVALEERLGLASQTGAEHLRERAELDPRVPHVVDRAAAHDRAGEQAAVETARTRARDDVRAKEAAREPEEPAVDRDRLVLAVVRVEARAPRTVDLRHDAADPDRKADAPVQHQRKPDLALRRPRAVCHEDKCRAPRVASQ